MNELLLVSQLVRSSRESANILVSLARRVLRPRVIWMGHLSWSEVSIFFITTLTVEFAISYLNRIVLEYVPSHDISILPKVSMTNNAYCTRCETS